MLGHKQGGKFHPHTNSQRGISESDFKELEKKSAQHYLGLNRNKNPIEESQKDRTYMCKIGHGITREECFKKMIEHGISKESAINLLSQARVNYGTGKLDFSMGWYQPETDAWKRITPCEICGSKEHFAAEHREQK